MPKNKSQSLSIFLIREGLAATDFLKPNLQKVQAGNIGQLYVRQNPSHPPRWLEFFDGALAQKPRLHNASNGALLVVKRGSRTFALAFGHGRHLLEPGTWEENFGLRVTLNSVDPGRLKSIDRKSFDAISCHTRTQASHEGHATAFGLNVEQDLLRAATGYPLDENLGTRMTGMDSLLVAAPIRIGDLPGLLDRYLTKFHDTAYKQTFPWVDHIAEIRDAHRRDKLDAALVEIMRHEDPSQMTAWLAVPELIEWADVGGFRYRNTTRAELHADLHVRDFLETVSDRTELDIAKLKARQVFAYDVAGGSDWTKRWPLYSCIYAELDQDGTTYLLSGGKWYRVDRDFVGTVNKEVARLARPSSLPKYIDGSEGAYNARVAKASAGKIALVDRKLVMIGGTPVEFCDLFTSGQMIHVKRYGGSSVLSHLFAQGSVSANAFLEDAAFRTAVNKKLPPKHRLADPSERPDPRAYEIVYAVISRSAKPIDQALPFFSRLNLRNAARQLRAYGYKVTLSKIAA